MLHRGTEKAMTKTTTAALVVAAIGSATAVCGAAYTGVTGNETAWNDDSGVRWAVTAVGVLLTALYGLLVAVLVRSGAAIDAGRRPVRVVRIMLVADLAVLAAVFVIGLVRTRHDGPLSAVAGVAFLLAFLLGAVLGALLLHRPELRTAALLLLAPLAVLPLTILVGLKFPDWGDPAFAEAALYLGLALLGAQPQAALTRPVTAAGRP
jgi:hypothetical protein